MSYVESYVSDEEEDYVEAQGYDRRTPRRSHYAEEAPAPPPPAPAPASKDAGGAPAGEDVDEGEGEWSGYDYYSDEEAGAQGS